jgi:dUTP pyrophosphatase
MKVKIKRVHPNAIIPAYAKESDAGLDLVATSIISNTTFQITYGLGIALEIPEGFVGLVFPRSSIRNTELTLSNSVGVIDSGYRGELQATFNKSNGLDSISYKVGERVCQIMIIPHPIIELTEVDELSTTERGTGGFGSTGK